MKPIRLRAPLLIATLMLLCGTAAGADETAQSASAREPGVVVKVEKAVKRGAKATARGVERGAKAAGRGLKRGANAAGRGVERGAKATGNAAHSVTKKISGSPSPASSPDK